MAMFVDMKAAFDSVDRKTIYGALRTKGVRKWLIERIREILRGTKSRAKAE